MSTDCSLWLVDPDIYLRPVISVPIIPRSAGLSSSAPSAETFQANEDSGTRVRIQGFVTRVWVHDNLFLQDDSGGLRIVLNQPSPAWSGALVGAEGFVSMSGA
jgi:hypothetical protein